MNFSIDIDWKQMASGPLWLRHLIAFFSGVMFFAVVLYFYIMPIRTDNQAMAQQVMSAQHLSNRYEQQLAALPLIGHLKEEIQALKERQKIHRYYPSATAKLTGIITDYVRLSGGQLIDLERETVANGVSDSGIVVHRWRLNIKVTYFQLFDFIQRINQSALLLTINNLAIRSGPDFLTLTMSLNLYQLKMVDE